MSERLTFRALHAQQRALVIPNLWDIATARILAAMGYKALATTSAGMAFSMGIVEGAATKQAVFAHCKQIVKATTLPVTADLEKGFGDTPEQVSQTIIEAVEIGLAGCSIEDHNNKANDPIYAFAAAVERIAAAAEASKSLSEDFVLTARSENFLWGRPDIDDTIARLQAFEKAGGDVLYAPGLYDLKTIELVCSSLTNPVNVVMGMLGATFSVTDLECVGVKRISVGSALSRLAYGAFVKAAKEIQQDETFTFADQAMGFAELEDFFK
ncbi:MAG: 2-methylisocitrate lyase-like PEP mutase family enzyme [Saprospiraceae bacterium]|jgi:2-methylisocitrate lyase-like PEP mutase family enzyme